MKKKDAQILIDTLGKSLQQFSPTVPGEQAIQHINRIAPDYYRAYNAQTIGTGSPTLDETIDLVRGGANAKKSGADIIKRLAVQSLNPRNR